MIKEEEIVNGSNVTTPGKEESSTCHQDADVDEIEFIIGFCLFCTRSCDAVQLVCSTIDIISGSTTWWAKLG